jgi:hypothetical protein
VSDEIPFVRKEFSDLVARGIYPSMKRAGLHRKGKRLWYEQRPESSWVLLEIQVSDRTTRTRLQFSVGTAVWPPGTWEYSQQSHPDWAAQEVPFVAHNAPISVRPAQVRPDLWPEKDMAEARLGDDLDRVVAELPLFLLAAAGDRHQLPQVGSQRIGDDAERPGPHHGLTQLVGLGHQTAGPARHAPQLVGRDPLDLRRAGQQSVDDQRIGEADQRHPLLHQRAVGHGGIGDDERHRQQGDRLSGDRRHQQRLGERLLLGLENGRSGERGAEHHERDC